VPPQGFRCTANFYKILYIRTLYFEKYNILPVTHTHRFIIDNIQHVLCFVFICLHSDRANICRYIFVMYSFVLPFREAKFCGVPSCVFDKLGCAACGKRLRNTAVIEVKILTPVTRRISSYQNEWPIVITQKPHLLRILLCSECDKFRLGTLRTH
jgi:hypothetical protein